MKRTFCLGVLFFLFAFPAYAQRTIVSGTVSDPNGLAYANASLTATLVTPVGSLGAYLGGAQVQGSVGPVQLDVNGSFLVQLADNTLIQCANAQGQIVACVPQTQWSFRVTAPGIVPPIGSGPQTCTTTLTISGTSQTVSSQLSSVCPSLTRGPGVPGAINPANGPYNAKFDARWTADGAITNGLPTVTSATINFTQADAVGNKKIYTINSATGVNRLLGTIVSVQSPTQATCSANATATEAGDGLVVCTDDTAAISSAWSDAIAKGKLLVIPAQATCVTSAPFTGSSVLRGSGFSIQGSGPSSIFVLTADYNGTLTFYSPTIQGFVFPDNLHSWPQVGNFTITGLSVANPGGGTTLFNVGSTGGAIYHDIVVNGFCGFGGAIFSISGSEQRISNVNLQGNGCPSGASFGGIVVSGTNDVQITNPIIAFTNGRAVTVTGGSGINITGGLITGTGVNPGSNPHTGISLQSGAVVGVHGTQAGNGSPNTSVFDVDGTSTLTVDNVTCLPNNANTSPCVNVQSGGKLYIGRNTQVTGNPAGISIQNNGTGTVFDDGTNLYVGPNSNTIPTCAMTTGGGTGPACSLIAGSTNEKGTVHMTPGTTPGNAGTTTVTFAGTFAGGSNTTPSCTFTLANTGTGTWNARGTVILSTRSTTVPVFAWDNNAVALTAASTYDVDYVCVPR